MFSLRNAKICWRFVRSGGYICINKFAENCVIAMAPRAARLLLAAGQFSYQFHYMRQVNLCRLCVFILFAAGPMLTGTMSAKKLDAQLPVDGEKYEPFVGGLKSLLCNLRHFHQMRILLG